MSPRPPPDPIPFLRLSVLTNQTPLPLFLSPLPMASPPPPLPSFPSAIADDAHSSSLDNIKPSVLIIVLILSITLFVSVSICLILRLLNGRCLRHLSPTSTTISTPATTSRVTPEHLQASSVLDSLPIFTFSSVTRRSAASAISGDCAVCLSKFEQNDQLRLLPICCHAFHAECIDTWISSNQSCPLCRSPLFTSDSDLMKMLRSSSSGGGNGGSDSFRLEIGSVSRRQGGMDSGEQRMSYSIGSFDYVVDDESEVSVNRTHHRNVSDKEEIEGDDATTEATLAAEVAAGRSWLKDYVDRLSFSISSRAMSFRSSGRFFSGSSRRSEVAAVDWDDVEANRVGEEISELFRWISGV